MIVKKPKKTRQQINQEQYHKRKTLINNAEKIQQ